MESGHFRSVRLDHSPFSIGRLPESDLVLTHKCVSREHAAIQVEEHGSYIVDKSSRHGTFVNGERVERAELRGGDTIHIGSLAGTTLRFQDGLQETTTSAELLKSLGAVNTAQDLGRLNWFLEAARKLNEVGPVEEILVALVQLTLQLTKVERGFVFLRNKKSGAMELALGRDADGRPLQEDGTLSHSAIQRATESTAKFVVTDTFQEQGQLQWASVVAKNIRSVFCIPLRKRSTEADAPENDTLGLLYLDSRIEAGNLTQVDHRLLDAIATEAAGLIENAFLAQAEKDAHSYRKEMNLAAQIQQALMVINLPATPYATLKALSVPCKEIGGDFYDVVALDDGICVTLADISGKGVSAAILAATLQGLIYAQVAAGKPFGEIATLVNQFLCQRNVGKYATMILLKLHPDGKMEYLNCGHLQPLVVDQQQVRRLENRNCVVGLIAGATYETSVHQMKPGERLFLITDGVTEAENAEGEFFGDERLDEAVKTHDLDGILREIVAFCAGNPANDDCTMVEACYLSCL